MSDNKAPDATASDTTAPETAAHEATSGEFIGRWNRLVSTTNWEKGRIINDWRAALTAAGASVQEYSDEAWSQRVGGVSSQHVGRLRRVAERFGESREQYDGLYWSHFLAALDWPDAEMWLEGAVQNSWSVSETRKRRWEAVGAPADQRPRDEDVIAAEWDEDARAALAGDAGATGDAAEPIVIPDAPSVVQSDSQSGRSKGRVEGDNAADVNNEFDAAAGGPIPFDPDSPQTTRGDEMPQPYRAFEQLGNLPEDLADALESFKLAILRHKMGGWHEVSSDDVLRALDALRQLVLAPSD